MDSLVRRKGVSLSNAMNQCGITTNKSHSPFSRVPPQAPNLSKRPRSANYRNWCPLLAVHCLQLQAGCAKQRRAQNLIRGPWVSRRSGSSVKAFLPHCSLSSMTPFSISPAPGSVRLERVSPAHLHAHHCDGCIHRIKIPVPITPGLIPDVWQGV